jgi:hypothetical protein
MRKSYQSKIVWTEIRSVIYLNNRSDSGWSRRQIVHTPQWETKNLKTAPTRIIMKMLMTMITEMERRKALVGAVTAQGLCPRSADRRRECLFAASAIVMASTVGMCTKMTCWLRCVTSLQEAQRSRRIRSGPERPLSLCALLYVLMIP